MAPRNYGLIGSVEELGRFFTRLHGSDAPIGFDIETGYLGPDRPGFSLHPETAIVVGFSFTVSTDWARYVPLRHDTGDANLDNTEVARLLWPLLCTGRAVIHNASFELRHLARWFRQLLSDDPEHGPAVRASGGYFPIRSDTQVEAYLVAEHQHFGLKYLAKAIFGHTMTELWELFTDLPKNKRKMLRFNILDPREARNVDYACEDAVWCLAIHQRYYQQAASMRVIDCACHGGLRHDGLLYAVEMGIVTGCIPDMEDFGVRYDWLFMRRGSEAINAFRDRFNAEIMAELSALTGEPTAINLASPPQISKVLYEKLGMRTTRWTPKTRNLPPAERKMSTDKIALTGLAQRHPVVRKILQWKEMSKLTGTYLDKYEDLYGYAADGRTHPSHNSAFVVTGRFAVSDPPYQQSPKVYHYDLAEAAACHAAHAEAHGKDCACDDPAFVPPPGTCVRFNFRDAIIAPPDHYILGFDLSQAELRAIAGEAGETALLRAFEAGQDVHTLTAALMLKISVEEVTKELRQLGKTMNFALLYGMGAKSLAERLGIDEDEAKALYDKYFAVYANIAAWAERQVEHGKRYGYVASRFGRRLPIWEYQSDKRWIRQKGDRACVNYPIQGAATGDYMKIAMVAARRALREAGLADRVHMVMNVHDALEFYVHRSVPIERVIEVLAPTVVFKVKGWPSMQADWHVARTWGSPMEIAVGADGSVTVNGEKRWELVPEVEVDEETGEEIVLLPEDLDPEVLRRATGRDRPAPGTVTRTDAGDAPGMPTAAAPPPRQPAPAPPEAERDEGRRVLVALADMPTAEAYERFLSWLPDGLDVLTLRTPEGEMEFPDPVRLRIEDTATVSLLLGPVTITYDAADVDSGAILAGIDI